MRVREWRPGAGELNLLLAGALLVIWYGGRQVAGGAADALVVLAAVFLAVGVANAAARYGGE